MSLWAQAAGPCAHGARSLQRALQGRGERVVEAQAYPGPLPFELRRSWQVEPLRDEAMEAPHILLLFWLHSQLHGPIGPLGRPLLRGPLLRRPEHVQEPILDVLPDPDPRWYHNWDAEVAAAGEVVGLLSASQDNDCTALALRRLQHGIEALVTRQEANDPLRAAPLRLVQERSHPFKDHDIRSVGHFGPGPVNNATHCPQRVQPVALSTEICLL
mmetsp:Transcript_12933/g.36894  ORF Transcript_12933/g.36894 Transcript_12933/m.36894 type:complete len:215 (-) Transcript_12933:595-1239(-)